MLSEQFLQRLDSMRLSLRTPAQGGSGGLRRSRALGTSTEFSDFREYVPGDDLRRVDWNACARFDRLFLKLFMEEQETRVNILLDSSASMAFGEPQKWDFARDLARIFAYLALRGGERVTLWTLGGEVKHTQALSGRAGYVQAAQFLENSAPAGHLMLSDCAARLPLGAGRGVSILITDLMSEDGYEKALRALAYRKQEISVLQVLSPWETAPSLEGMVQLTDMENGNVLEIAAGEETLRRYQQALEAFLHDAKRFCHAHNMAYMTLRSDMDVEKTVLRELSRAGLIE